MSNHLRYEQIGKQFGMHKQQVHRILKRWKGWVKPSTSPFAPGDVVSWKGKQLTVIDANATEGTLQDTKGVYYRHFTWAGPTALKKVGVNEEYLKSLGK